MRTFPFFAVLFFILPILEIYILIKAGSSELLGPGWTIFLVVLTAVIGAVLLRQQGLSTLARFQQSISQGKLPAQEMVEGILLAVGGALLMTPGFITDAMGFLCLLPFSRQLLAKLIIKRSSVQVVSGMGGFSQTPEWRKNSRDSTSDVVEGEFTEIDEDTWFIEQTGQSPKSKNKS